MDVGDSKAMGIPSSIPSVRSQMLDLQVEQHHHDEKYHREIARLSIHQRLNHMALHFAKYAGKIALNSDLASARTVFCDILIISLSTANVLNVELWGLLEHEGKEFSSLAEVANSFAFDEQSQVASHATILREIVIASGRMAAACEKVDHLEEISFRHEIRQSIGSLAQLAITRLAYDGADPAFAVRERLAQVKTRLVLHGRV